MSFQWGWVVPVVGLAIAAPTFAAADVVKVPMTAAQWEPRSATTKIDFIAREGFPQGLMDLKSGAAVLKDRSFGDGTINFDLKIVGDGAPGIKFRQVDNDTAEVIYFRPSPDCPVAQDCIQYAPKTHGALLWDVYPQYQSPAPITLNAWNHMRMVLSGHRMNVYINGSASPTLSVGRLEGDSLAGSIQIMGPAIFTNFTLAPGVVDGLPSDPVEDPTALDGRYLRDWRVSAFSLLPPGQEPALSQMPGPRGSWSDIQAERNGLVNVSRLYKTPDPGQLRCMVWLTSQIDSTERRSQRVSIGWLREVWVFVNGEPVFSGRNFWDPPGPKRTPDGRISLENSSFTLPLKKGLNQIAIALSNEESDSASHFGWGIEMRMEDMAGITLTTKNR